MSQSRSHRPRLSLGTCAKQTANSSAAFSRKTPHTYYRSSADLWELRLAAQPYLLGGRGSSMLIILQSRLQEIALVVRRLFASLGGTNEIVDSQLSIPSPSLVFWRRPSTLSNLLRLLSRKPFWNLIPAAESSPLPRSWVTRSSLGRAPASFVPAGSALRASLPKNPNDLQFGHEHFHFF